MGACVCACVCVCVCVLRMVSTDKILRFINTLLLLIKLTVCKLVEIPSCPASTAPSHHHSHGSRFALQFFLNYYSLKGHWNKDASRPLKEYEGKDASWPLEGYGGKDASWPLKGYGGKDASWPLKGYGGKDASWPLKGYGGKDTSWPLKGYGTKTQVGLEMKKMCE